jgi:hypothetical protein
MVIRFCYKDRAQTIIQSINDQLNVDTQTKHRMKLNNHIIHYRKNQNTFVSPSREVFWYK